MEAKEIIRSMKLFLFDMDGTLYIGDQLFPKVPELLKQIHRVGANYMFMTNNSSKSVADYIIKLEKLGIAATEDDFITTIQATGDYLNKNYNGKKVYVCGTDSLKKELLNDGFVLTENEEEVECVLVGFDTELTYSKVEKVCRLLMTKNIPYIATNPDLACPTPFGFVPDCGSICQMIFNATGRRPVFTGKPSARVAELAMEKHGVQKNQTCVVGDRIYTDIKCGLNADITAILVLTGEANHELLAKSEDKPNIVLDNVGQIYEMLKNI